MRSKAILMALLVFAFGSVEAAHVTSEQAKRAASAWARSGTAMGLRLPEQVSQVKEFAVTNGYSFFEVKMTGGGTVFVSSDTEFEPIVGFSAKGNLDVAEGSPLLDLLKRDIVARAALKQRAAKMQQTATSATSATTSSAATPAEKKWAALLKAVTAADPHATGASGFATGVGAGGSEDPVASIDDVRVAPLIDSKWSQTYDNHGNPLYNYYVPEEIACGCTATAASQIMRYFRYPTAHMPQQTYVCTVNGVEGNYTTKAGKYDWDNMPADPNTNNTPEQREAVGRLCYDVAAALGTSWSTSGGGSAYATDLPRVFCGASFGYKNAYVYYDYNFDKSETTYDGGLHVLEAREKTIYANLDAKRPVELGIHGYAKGHIGDPYYWSGHAVVGDGYGFKTIDGEKVAFVHINMGWAGQDDLWYNIPEVNAANSGAHVGDSGYDFLFMGSALFNISPDDTGDILSGRVTDDEGVAIVGATVEAADENGVVVSTTTTDGKGIYAFSLPGGHTYGISAKIVQLSGRVLMSSCDVVLDKTKSDPAGGIVTLSDIGNRWGNDLELSEPTVRIGDQLFTTLDKALSAATNGNETIEILLPTTLKNAMTISTVCTITATNPVASASKVFPASGAKLTLADGSDVTFRNVAFKHDNRQMVDAQAGSVLRVSGVADLGEVRLATDENLRLVGALQSAIVVDAPFAKGEGESFGRFANYTSEAGATAVLLLNKYNDELGGESYYDTIEDRHQIRWVNNNGEVPEGAAAVRYDADPAKYYRSLSVFFKYNQDGGSVCILRDTTLTNKLTFASGKDLFLYGADEGAVLTPASSARFTIEDGGSLVISNLTVSGYTGPRLFHVRGGEMTLSDGAVLRDLECVAVRGCGYVDTDARLGGVTALERGTLRMLPGAGIYDSRAVGDGECGVLGGGIYACGGKLELLGGQIAGCTAFMFGGGVYADMQYGDLDVNLAGDLNIAENFGNADLLADDLCICGVDIYGGETVHRPVVVEPLTADASIGINYVATDTSEYSGNAKGDEFVRIASTLTSEEAAAAVKAFFNDTEMSLRAAVDDEGEETVLRWTESTVGPDEAVVMTIYDELTDAPTTNYFRSVEEAFANLTNDATVVVLTNDVSLTEDVIVRHQVVIRSDVVSEPFNVLYRDADISFTVGVGASLVVSNLIFHGCGEYKSVGDQNPFLYVNGGSLALGANAVIYDVYGDGSPSACAVYVINDGVFRMEEGALIEKCTNDYYGSSEGIVKDADAGLAGGVVLAGGTAYLRGGLIENCCAWKGGAVFIGNGSKAYVSGTFQATYNGRWKDGFTEGEKLYARISNFTYDGEGAVVLSEEFNGSIGVSAGWDMTSPISTNVFGYAEYAGDPYDLVLSAANILNDLETAYGVIATNDVCTLLVWSAAIKTDEQTGALYYEDENGNRSGVVTEPRPVPPQPGPTPEPVKTNNPSAIAFESITRLSETEWRLVVTNRVQWCRYALTSTDDLSKGFTITNDWEQAETAGAWTNDVTTSGGQYFWRALGTWGIVPKND